MAHIYPPESLAASLRLDLDFPLRSKSNFRRRASSSSWESYRGFEIALAALARAARPKVWDLGDPDSPLSERPTVVMVIIAHTLLDTSNLSKSVADALEHELYHNDASVRLVLSLSTRGRADQRATILLAQLTAGASADNMRSAMDYLLDTYDPDA